MNSMHDNLDSLLNRPAVTQRNLAGNSDPTPQPAPHTGAEMLAQVATLKFFAWDRQGGASHATPQIVAHSTRSAPPLLASPLINEVEPDRYSGHLFHVGHGGGRLYCLGLRDLHGWSETMLLLLPPSISPPFFRAVAAAGCVIVGVVALDGTNRLTVAIREEQFTDAYAYVTGPQGATTGGH